MSWLDFFRRGATAPVARERLQILLSHERAAARGEPDLLAKLREEILAVVTKHVTVDQEKVEISMDRGRRYRRSRSMSKSRTRAGCCWRGFSRLSTSSKRFARPGPAPVRARLRHLSSPAPPVCLPRRLLDWSGDAP